MRSKNDVNYETRYRHKLNMLEPGIVMVKWIAVLALAGLILLFLHWRGAACFLLGLSGTILAVLLLLLVIESHQDRVLNEIAMRENKDMEE